MDSYVYVPHSMQAAGRQVRMALGGSLQRLTKDDFLRAWCSIVYLFPGLHPKEVLESGPGGPKTLRRFAAEAWRRFQAGELTDNELYCYQTATIRIQRECDRLRRLKPWLFRDHFTE